MPETTEYVEILVGAGDQADVARKLLDAAEDPEQVQTITLPTGFRVPRSVAEGAGYPVADLGEGEVVAVPAKTVEGYAVEQVTPGPTAFGARSNAGESDQGGPDEEGSPGARAAEPGEVETGLGDRQIEAELARDPDRAERVDEQPPLGERSNVTTEGSGVSLTSNRVTTTEFSGVESGGVGGDPAESNPPGTLTDPRQPEVVQDEVARSLAAQRSEEPPAGQPEPRQADQDPEQPEEQGGQHRAAEQPPARRSAEDDELTPDKAAELRGDALDDALRARGLPHTTGTADEKRQRLADHLRRG